MKPLFFLMISFCFAKQNFAQYLEKQNLNFNGISYDAIIFKVDSNISNRFYVLENDGTKTEEQIFESIQGSFFAVNAGTTDANCDLLGLYIKEKVPTQPINLNNGEGNFYIKPNGFIGFLNNEIDIKNATKFNSSVSYQNAIQNGPMLISDNVINPNFNVNSTNKNFRVGVGTFFSNNGQFMVFALSNSPLSFYQFAAFFSEKFKCNNALVLEGGEACSMHLPTYKKTPSNTKKSCKYFVLNL
jgi:hypothetical protein